ncbi:hypothetical protein DAPPUDRAFT_318761 [Daphnia pulex]|uniref:Myb-like domain-containing protein n=1 Tax=Daphnia pulex TaxID=6669 RepID=E9GJM3_DAPPU|nr:hypothetical protein DAPPUDRAFT_318761 [Daphnia pulex]|eukprot:EFX80292.1 hypothetical protein DAPPUDRAFT_318761 [Daphnia pulex]
MAVVTPNSICENPEGSKNGEENDPLNTEEPETIEQLKQSPKQLEDITLENNRLLAEIVSKYENKVNWIEVAQEINNGRTAFDCFLNYQKKLT